MRVNLTKRLICFLLCNIMLIGYMPLSIMASQQKSIKITNILSQNKTAPQYSFEIRWQNPDWELDSGEKIEGAKLKKENVTLSNDKLEENIKFTGNETNMIRNEINLVSGSLYEYEILPYHIHTDASGKPANVYPLNAPEDSGLFMTDIEVSARGYIYDEKKGALEVKFHNPTYRGKNVFTGYNIYYQEGTSTGNFNNSVKIDINNPDLIPSKDPNTGTDMFTYTIVDENIKPSTLYSVKVEPVYNGQEIKKMKNPMVMINDSNKVIGFNSKEYRTDDAYVSIPLNIYEDGKDFLQLEWLGVDNLVSKPNIFIKKIDILSGPSKDEITNVIGTLHGNSSKDINNWRIAKPSELTYYKIRVCLTDNEDSPENEGCISTVESEINWYDPAVVNVTPNRPNIYPKLQEGKTVIDLYWDTFSRPAYNEEEKPSEGENGLLIDMDVVYDVWITDSLKNLDRMGLPKILDRVPADQIQITSIPDTRNKVFYNQITEYMTLSDDGNYVKKPLEDNKTYYIKIIARKPISEEKDLSSMPAISQIYLPPMGDISTPKAVAKPPFRVKRDENGSEVITQTDITVEWNTKWFEVYDETINEETGRGTWHSLVALRDGELVFGKDVKPTDKIIEFYNKDTEAEVRNAFIEAGYTNANSLIIRDMDISAKDIQYEMIVLPTSEIESSGGYEAYIESLLASESNLWQQISPVFTDPKYAEHLISGLTANTTYAILLRPYRVLLDGRKEAYPTYILATTLPDDSDVDVTPTIPRLYEVGKTDISIEVEWENQSNKIIYELAIDENGIEDPSQANIIIDSQNIKDNGVYYNKEDSREFIKYNIKPLFPDTGYYIWIRAIVEETGKTSDWSTPLYIRTNPIEKPEPPRGFGLASEKSLSTYNTTNNTDYKPSTDKYLILEWLRDFEDTAQEPKADAKDTAEPLLDPNLKETYMVKFNELLANRYYYTRAKTKVYVSKGNDGIEKLYSYIIQLSLTKDFKDVIEIEIPTVEPKGDRVLTAESDWTDILRYKTKFSEDGGDYDGNIIDDLYPLPTEDFEILYDSTTKTLTYRFRSNKKDANGNDDNLVDQRFITKLINNKVYNYDLNLTSHNGYIIENRKIEIPYTIISAFEQRKISLSITIGGTRFTLNPGFLNTPEVKTVGKLGTNTTTIIEITQNPEGLPVLVHNQIYGTTPQYIKISINNNGVYTPITYTGSNMDIMLKLKNRSLTLENNVGAYRNINNNVWERIPSTYSSETGIHAVKTNRLGKYTTISNGVNKTNINGINDVTLLTNVNNKIIFTDMVNINTKSPISVVQFNNIVAGIANNKREISINGGLSTEDYQSLQNAGMLLQGSVVGREAGINILVKLYEMKTKTKYEPISNINTTPYQDIKNANKTYQVNLIKAGDIGFYGNAAGANPKGIMTIEEVLYIIDIILADSGY